MADFDGKPKEYFKETAWLACHAINPQWIARNSTGVYLQYVADADLFSDEVSEHLRAAGQHYRDVYSAWQDFYTQLGHNAPEDAWDTEDNRRAGASAAQTAVVHETAAIDCLKQALSKIRE